MIKYFIAILLAYNSYMLYSINEKASRKTISIEEMMERFK